MDPQPDQTERNRPPSESQPRQREPVHATTPAASDGFPVSYRPPPYGPAPYGPALYGAAPYLPGPGGPPGADETTAARADLGGSEGACEHAEHDAGADLGGISAGPADPASIAARNQLAAIGLRAGGAASWLQSARQYEQLINADGYVPVTARFRAEDLAFLGRAREELRALAELGLRLVELHQLLDADPADPDPAGAVLRCRSCMWRWPCPTFRIIAEVLGRLDVD